ncbi:glucosaminidase domain-containing protein [Pullulanibacillus sp. KACC 23026]|uniref:glucosaminidase domain-containing protein n=1 Tax=Pullulanibacillus sp. KACC 23026 TaxID=3028315 RepID=UPI0023AF438E|nr:glucosaminidase domain-containing protein [Pullulanibacillus sp. KACC 23026]WEG13308.1 glucosaminidase domain-containing protein [Pullulanibacillus sp. KACC 23026]
MQRKLVIFLGLFLFGLILCPKGSFAEDTDSTTNAVNFASGSSYDLIDYNGEEQKVAVNDDVTLTLTGWTDATKTAVKGILDVQTSSSEETQNITLKVTDVLQHLVTADNQTIYLRIDQADSFKAESVTPQNLQNQNTVMTQNDNGTSIEEVKTVDEYGTVINNQGYKYYKTDGTNQKVEVTKSDYDALNTPPSVTYTAHVQSYGWMSPVSDGALAGTTGQSKRMEAIKLSIKNGQDLSLTYSAHVQSYGWMNEVSDGQMAGTTGQSKRMEAIKINLTGTQAADYDVYYRVHVQHYGWLDWAKDGEPAGTQGYSLRMEAIQVELVKKGDPAPGSTDQPFIVKPPSVNYSSHVQSYGWMPSVSDGTLSGTTGQAKRLEAIKIQLKHSPYSGDIVYSTHVQTYGWLKNVSDGELSGTTGEGKRVEAINISLTGDIANYYDVYYRAYVQSYGWLGWAKDGMNAGTQGLAKRMEAIQIKLVPKGQGDSVSETDAFKKAIKVNPVPEDPADPSSTTGNSTTNNSTTNNSTTNNDPTNDSPTNVSSAQERLVSSVSFPVYRSYDELADYQLNSTIYNPSYTRYDVLGYGDKVTVLSEENYAAEIQTADGLVGWVQKDYLVNSLTDDMWLVKEGRTLRSSADVTSANIGYIPSGSMVYLLDKVTTSGPTYTEWYYIQTQSGQKGWVWGALSTSGNQGYDLIKYEASKAGTVTDQVDIFTPLNTMADVTADQINAFINYKTGGQTTVMTGMGEAYLTAQAQSGLNAIYLLAHSGLETGWGTSAISNTKYNFYGIGAIDSQPAEGAYDYSSPEGGIIAGACWISDNYVIRSWDTDDTIPYYQPTLDSMRNDNSWHQYASDEAWAVKIGYFMQQFYDFINQ